MPGRRDGSEPDASTAGPQPWREWLSGAGASSPPFLCDGNCRRLFESDVVGVILGEIDGEITEANDAFLELTGYTRADLPLRLDTTMSKESGAPDALVSEALLRSRGAVTEEGELVAKDGSRIPVLVGAANLTKTGPEYIAFVLDLTRTREVEVALKRSEQRFKALYDNSPSLSLTVRPDGTIVSVNSHGARELGYKSDELVGSTVFELFQEQDCGILAEQIETTSSRPGTVVSRDLRSVRQDGSTLWLRGSTFAMVDSDGQPLLLLVCKDLTEHKQYEQRLLEYQEQLRALSLDVTLAEEQERRRIALGLHDAVGHGLALARMKLQAFRRDEGGGLDDSLGEVRDLIDEAIQATRALTFELSSPVLYELGLEAALDSAGERVADANRLRFEFESDGLPKPLSTDASVVLYRCAQELLVNAVKHGRAGCLTIQVARVEDRIEIAIIDDGVGFDPDTISERHVRGRGYGLLSIREQLHAIGGHMDLDTAPGRGTRCTLAAPLGSPEA